MAAPRGRKAIPQLGHGQFVDMYSLPVVQKFARKQQSYYNYDQGAKCFINPVCRIAIIGSTGSRKTQTAANIIADIGLFQQLFIVATDLSDAVYQGMQESPRTFNVAEEVLEMDKLEHFADMWNEAEDDVMKMVVFDDVLKLRLPQSVVDVYSRGRRKNWSCIFVNQSFFQTDSFVRQNTGYVCLKKITQEDEVVRILRNYHLNVALLDLYQQIMLDPTAMMMLDLVSPDETMRVRRNYTPIVDAMKLAVQKPLSIPKLQRAPRKTLAAAGSSSEDGSGVDDDDEIQALIAVASKARPKRGKATRKPRAKRSV